MTSASYRLSNRILTDNKIERNRIECCGFVPYSIDKEKKLT